MKVGFINLKERIILDVNNVNTFSSILNSLGIEKKGLKKKQKGYEILQEQDNEVILFFFKNKIRIIIRPKNKARTINQLKGVITNDESQKGM